MPWTFIQGAQNTSGSGSSSAVTLTNPVGVGNAICGSIFYAATSNIITSIVDDQNNNYSIIDFVSGVGGFGFTSFWSGAQIFNTPQTVTVNVSASQPFLWLQADEFLPPIISNINLISDGHSATTSGSGSTASSGNFTTSIDGDLIYSSLLCNGAAAVGSGFIQTEIDGPQNYGGEYMTQSSKGAIAGTWSGSNGANACTGFAIGIQGIPVAVALHGLAASEW